jgi:hypothetical protein
MINEYAAVDGMKILRGNKSIQNKLVPNLLRLSPITVDCLRWQIATICLNYGTTQVCITEWLDD